MPRHLPRSLAALAAASTLLLAACSGTDDTATDPSAGDDAPTATPSRDASGVECSYPEDGQPASREVEPPPSAATVSGEVEGTIATNQGELGITLDGAAAPCTVTSFVSLADQGYFDGTECHRLTTAGIFVLQCGDPSATGSGGPGYSFDDELTGDETYPAGTLAMANAGPNTNGSQFFVVYEDTALPASYTVFGSVDDAGLEVVREIASEGADDSFGTGDGAPNAGVTMESVSVS